MHKQRKERPEIRRCLDVVKKTSQKAIPSNTTAGRSSQNISCSISLTYIKNNGKKIVVVRIVIAAKSRCTGHKQTK